MDTLIELRNVGKWYTARRPIVHGVDLDVRRGQILAICGRNGSGKTTLLKLLAGIGKPSVGVIRRAAGVTVGYAPERFPPVRFRAEEYLRHLGRIRRIPGEELNGRIRELMELFRLGADGPITHFSKGMMQKVNLMQAMLARPDVLILDEPLSGLDAGAQAELARLLEEYRREGRGVVLTGHEPGFAEGLADRFFAIRNGTVEELRVRQGEPADASDTSAWICNQWGMG